MPVSGRSRAWRRLAPRSPRQREALERYRSACAVPPGSSRSRESARDPDGRGPRIGPLHVAWRAVVASLALSTVLVGLIGPGSATPAGVVLGLAGVAALAHSARRSGRTRTPRADGDPERLLASALERVAACLDAGVSVPDALRVVAAAEPAQVAALLRGLAEELAPGPPPGHWPPPGHGPSLGVERSAGSDFPADPGPGSGFEAGLPPIGEAGLASGGPGALGSTAVVWTTTSGVIRGSRNQGSRLADQLREQARQLRQIRREGRERKGQRVLAAAVLPLGCCFLPAFLLVAVAPVVVAFLGDLPDVS